MLRFLQGFGVGGEYGGAVLLAVEYAPPEKRGLFGSAAHIGVPGGLFLASGAFSIASLLPDEPFLAWGWRACFLISILLLAIGAYIRLQVMETPAFARVQERKEVAAVPLRDLLAAQPKRLLLGMGTRYVEGFTFNLYSVYLLAYIVTNLELPKQWALNGILVGSVPRRAPRAPRPARCRDKHGRKPVFRVGAWARAALRVPDGGARAERVASRRSSSRWSAASGVLYGVVYGPLAAFWSELFDTRYRYTALSSLYQISGIVASGLTPLIAAWLVSPRRRLPVAGLDVRRRRRGDQPVLRPAAARDRGP